MGYRVVVVGATGNVGREMLTILSEREFPIDEIAAVASPRSHGTEIEFGETGKMLKCKNIEHFDFAKMDSSRHSSTTQCTTEGSRAGRPLRPRGIDGVGPRAGSFFCFVALRPFGRLPRGGKPGAFLMWSGQRRSGGRG